MLNFLFLYFAHCQSLWVKNLRNLKGHLDKEASVVGNLSTFLEQCCWAKKNLEISVLSFKRGRGAHSRITHWFVLNIDWACAEIILLFIIIPFQLPVIHY